MDEQGNQMADKETVGEDGTGSFGLHGPGPYQEPPVWMRTSEGKEACRCSTCSINK